MLNPFFHRGPIRDRNYFYGRERIIQRTLSFLAAQQSVALVGPRRVGRTSLVLHLADPKVQQAYGFDPAQLTCLYLDCESLGHVSAGVIYGRLQRAAQRLQPDSAVTLNDQISFSELEADLYRVLGTDRRIIFILDEFDTLSNNTQLNSDFYSSLRALATEYNIAYVTVSTMPLLALTYPRAQTRSSPFFNFFALIRLGLFGMEEARAFVTKIAAQHAVVLPEALVDHLLSLAGPHPLLLQIAAYHVTEQILNQGHARIDTYRLREAFEQEARDHWGVFWRALQPEDQRHLALLHASDGIRSDRMRLLEEAGLITVQPDGTSQLVSPAFQDFVGTQKIQGLVQAPPLTIDPALRLVLLRGHPLTLSPQQFDLLMYLVERQERVVSREELAQAIWGRNDASSMDSLRTTLRALRETLADDQRCIQSVRGQGCRFVGYDWHDRLR